MNNYAQNWVRLGSLVTDHRAIVARIEDSSGVLKLRFLTPPRSDRRAVLLGM
jgi:hypothetical protein